MGAEQIILIVFIVILLIAYPVMMYSRNKKENQRMQEQTNSLKRGDKVLTTSGVYGTVIDLHMESDKKIVTLETGTDKNKGYLSVDAFAIYTIFNDENQQEPEVKTEDVESAEVSASASALEEEKKDEVFEKTEVESEVKEKSNKKNKKGKKE